MEKSEIVEIVNQSLAEEFELDAAAMVPEAEFHKDLGLDSLDSVDMVIVLEQAFKIKIRNNFTPENMRTLGGVYTLIEDLQSNQGKGTPA